MVDVLVFFLSPYLKHKDDLSEVFGFFPHTMTEAVIFTYSGYEAARCNYSFKFPKACIDIDSTKMLLNRHGYKRRNTSCDCRIALKVKSLSGLCFYQHSENLAFNRSKL